jgi:microcystin-dependent protein
MTDQFLAEIRVFAGNFAPSGWATCDGQLLPITQNTALFSLLGTTYGGDGRTSFGLPNLMGSGPLQQGQGPGLSQHYLGEVGGQADVTLLTSEMPTHTHLANAVDAAGTSGSPQGAVWAQARYGRGSVPLYGSGTPNQLMGAQDIGVTGQGLPHNNMPPYLTVTFIIALQGIFPARP